MDRATTWLALSCPGKLHVTPILSITRLQLYFTVIDISIIVGCCFAVELGYLWLVCHYQNINLKCIEYEQPNTTVVRNDPNRYYRYLKFPFHYCLWRYETVYIILSRRAPVSSPWSECTGCHQQGLQTVKHCTNKILQFLTGGAG